MTSGRAPGSPWYAGGLAFECTRCGNCCTGEPGSVRVDPAEVMALARRLGVSVEEFRSRWTRALPGGGASLRERDDGACVFWYAEHGCSVYAERPRQCRTWPFWRANLATPQAWSAAARRCPGIGRGALVDDAVIEASAARSGTAEGRADPRVT